MKVLVDSHIKRKEHLIKNSKDDVDSDILLSAFKDKTPKELSKWIAKNTKDLDSAIIVLEAFGTAIQYLLNNRGQ